MYLHALREQIGSRFVIGTVSRWKSIARGTGDGFLAIDERANHVFGVFVTGSLVDAGQAGKSAVGACLLYTSPSPRDLN